MPRLPVLSGRRLVKLLMRSGFQIIRQKGSHVSMQSGRHQTVVPLHKELAKGTLLGILKQCGLTADDLRHLLGA